MSADAKALLDSFEALSQNDQRQVAAIILRRTELWDEGPLTDDDLTSIADERFQELDAEESVLSSHSSR